MLGLHLLVFLINTILSKNLLVELAEDKNRTSSELGTEYKSLKSVLDKTEVQEEMKEEMEGDNANMAIMMVI